MGESDDETGTIMKKITELPGLLNILFMVYLRSCIDGACRADFSQQLLINQTFTVTDSGLKSALQNKDNIERVHVSQQSYHKQFKRCTVENFLIFLGLSFDY